MLSADLLTFLNPSHLYSSNHCSFHHSSTNNSLSFRHSLQIRRLGNLVFLHFGSIPKFQVYAQKEFHGRKLEIVIDEFVDTDCSDLPVELCLTRTLDPALTLRHAVDAMKEAVTKLKLDPPCSRSGVLRFQIAVPPSVKSLKWSYLQYKFSLSFPQFYLATKKKHEQFHGTTRMLHMVGVSGVGSAITFRGSSDLLRGYNLMERYLSFESPLIRTYGFTNVELNMKSNEMYDHPGSFYFFIPQIEVNEFENISFLASNLVWDNSLSYTLNEAVNSLEMNLHQISLEVLSACTQDMGMRDCFGGQSGIRGKDSFKMVYMNAEALRKLQENGRFLSAEVPTNSEKCYYRHSKMIIFMKDMFSHPRGESKINECTDLNLLWASLIVEECVRLGLTYFCIAPGSRSSPLALSACNHSLTTCTSCYDERSLAFHALGYARGSHKPAVVITSSGTAVSNLFPAVVEACQDFVPLLLLTADRPPELQDAGANQAIDQVNHFGKFVRFFYSLPPPTDQISARMVLTTIDSAVYYATKSLRGPVHINCPFRESLEGVSKEWAIDCLKGLNTWMSKEEPFTQYIKIQHAWGDSQYQMVKVVDVINNANQGLLLLGAIHTDDDIWAALLLAKHLSWPIVPDVLSGLRMRKLLTSCHCSEDYLFLDHLDHVLLSESVKSWLQPDVVVQIGRRVTSKRIGQLLEFCSPFAYVFVDNHPNRQDPSHLVTHRVQCSITEFTEILLVEKSPKLGREWSHFLKQLNLMVAMEISFQIYSNSSLTEPYVAHVVGEILNIDTALFIGNSMPIRDVDMYGKGWMESNNSFISLGTSCSLAFLGLRVSGNRGASGIDGVLSTSIGFAVGSKKHVVCVIGDVSFLHDTNGLAILSNRTHRQPMTIIVINNHGGAIFSLLPIARSAQPSVLNQYFYTSHDISIGMLCNAHRVKHLLVRTKKELHLALKESKVDYVDCVIEVGSCITDNANFHSIISRSSSQTADQVLCALSEIPGSHITSGCQSICKIWKVEYSQYRIQLFAPPTSNIKCDMKDLYHEGFILTITFEDNTIGYGEIAPIEIHKENLLDVEEQLRFLVHIMEGTELNCLLPLLKGSFSQWIWKTLGIPPSSIFPSVRCGLEMAILNALARSQGSSSSGFLGYQSSLISTQKVADESKEAGIPICALVDCRGTPNVVANVVSNLYHEGFTTVKIKVARQEDPTEDAAIINEIREMLGYRISIRVDANRKWTYDKAVHFGSLVKSLALEYIEEPVCFENDIVRFCEETGLPVALDETIDDVTGETLHNLEKFVHPGIVAVVIKPSVVGGFENAALIAKWAHLHDKMAIVSSAFESSLGLSAYVKFAHYLDNNNKLIAEMKRMKLTATAAHGLGTFQWLQEDVSVESLRICKPPDGSRVEASIEDADIFLRSFQLNHEVIQKNCRGERVRSYKSEVNGNGISCSFNLLETGGNKDGKVVIFLHGFLGSSKDWIPLMKALSTTTRCISMDLPGHGESCAKWHMNKLTQEPYQSIETVSELLLQLICNATSGGVILVGYSMGGRIALYMSLKYHEKIDGAILISGSPGLRDEYTRRIRLSQDGSRASYLLSHGIHSFLEIWYEGNLWKSLRDHPLFRKIISQREKHKDIRSLAKVLSDLSTGRQRPLWDELKHCKKPLLLIVGEKDIKFRSIAEEICGEIKSSCTGGIIERGDLCEMVVIPECGHAAHLENPFPVISAVRNFLTKVERK